MSSEPIPPLNLITHSTVSQNFYKEDSNDLNNHFPADYHGSENNDSLDNENDYLKKADEDVAPTSKITEIPRKPTSAYITVSFLCLMIAFGGYIFGWDTGTIGGFINQTDFQRRFGQRAADGTYYFSKVRTGLIVSIFNVGCAIGGIAFSRIGDVWGRRFALVWVSVVYMIGLAISISSINKWYQYFIGRIISGMGVGGIAVYSPLMISEVSPKHIRGTLVACYQLMTTLGIFIGYCTNFGTKRYSNSTQWRVPLGLGFAWALLMIAAMFFVPESPRFLIEVDRIEDAKKSIARSNKVDVNDTSVQDEVDLLRSSIEMERAAGNATWKELFSPKDKILQRLIMGIFIQSLQQLTGANYFFYYGTSIFKSVGLEDSFETSIIIGVVNFVSTFFGIYFVEIFGRRKCLLWGSAAMICCYVVYASVGVTRLYPNGKSQPSSKGAGNCMIVFTCFFIFSFATTWAPIAFVVVAETFPLRIKTKAMSISISANWTWNFLISFFTPFITDAINFYYGYVFMGCCVFAFLYVFFFVPETKGLTLEEVNTMWQENVLPWKSSNWVPPARRSADYNAEELAHDERSWYKKILG